MLNLVNAIPARAKNIAELGNISTEMYEDFLRIQPEAKFWSITKDEPPTIDRLDVLLIRGEFFIKGLSPNTLKKWVSILSPDGQLLLDFPNPVYIRDAFDILGGSRENIGRKKASLVIAKALLESYGLYVWSIRGVHTPKDESLVRQEEYKPIFDELAKSMSKYGGHLVHEGEASPLMASYLIRAGKKPQNSLYVHTIVGERIVTPWVRVVEPQSFLDNEAGVETTYFTPEEKALPNIPREFLQKILIRHRLTFGDEKQAQNIIKAVRELGYMLVTEIDDMPPCVNEEHSPAELSFVGVHGIQVSTEPLAELLRKYNPNVAVFANHLKELPEQRIYEDKDYVTFFYGALNRTHEWCDVMPVLKQAIEKYGSRLRFKVISDKEFFDALPTEHKKFIGSPDLYDGRFVSYYAYNDALHSSDISFLPLTNTPFNSMKSDLKFIESAGNGAVVLASPTVYERTVEDGKTGFIYRTQEEFKNKLGILIEDRARRIKMAESAYQYIKAERLLSQHYEERLNWYRGLLSRRGALDKSLDERLRKWNEY